MDYITSETYYTVYTYSVTGKRVLVGTFATKINALREARKYENWQIERTQYLTNLPL